MITAVSGIITERMFQHSVSTDKATTADCAPIKLFVSNLPSIPLVVADCLDSVHLLLHLLNCFCLVQKSVGNSIILLLQLLNLFCSGS